jgi:hypothetical protein
MSKGMSIPFQGGITAAQGIGEIYDLLGPMARFGALRQSGIGDSLGYDREFGFTTPRDEFLKSVDPRQVGILEAAGNAGSHPIRGLLELGRGTAETAFDTPYEMMRSRGMVPSGTPAAQARQELPQQMYDATVGRYREAARERALNQQLREQGLNPTYNDSAAPQLPFATRAIQSGLRNTLPFGMGNYLPF